MSVVETLPTVQLILSRYVLPTFLTFGLIGCIFNIIIFLQKTLRSNACSIYMLAVSIINLIEIPYSLSSVTILPATIRPTSVIYCRISGYVQHYLLNVVRTYTVLACIDRFTLTSTNVRIRRFSSASMARKSVIISTIIWLFIPLHMCFFYESILSQRCGVSGTYAFFFSIYSTIVTGGHLILMISFSSLAIYNIRKSQLRIHPVNGQGNNLNRIKKRDVQLVKMLIAEVIVYVFTSTSFPIFNIYSVITDNISKTSSQLAIENFVAFFGPNFLVLINPCTTFYVNLCASQSFRNVCKHLILYKWRGNNNLQGTGVGNRRRGTNGNEPTQAMHTTHDDGQFFT